MGPELDRGTSVLLICATRNRRDTLPGLPRSWLAQSPLTL